MGKRHTPAQWSEAEHLYRFTETTLEDIAAKTSMDVTTLRSKARDKDWVRPDGRSHVRRRPRLPREFNPGSLVEMELDIPLLNTASNQKAADNPLGDGAALTSTAHPGSAPRRRSPPRAADPIVLYQQQTPFDGVQMPHIVFAINNMVWFILGCIITAAIIAAVGHHG